MLACLYNAQHVSQLCLQDLNEDLVYFARSILIDDVRLLARPRAPFVQLCIPISHIAVQPISHIAVQVRPS